MTRGARIRVDAMTAATRGYEVHIRSGALDELALRIGAAAPAAAYAVIAPHALADSYAARALESLRGAGMTAQLLEFNDAEVKKTRDTWAALTDRMIEMQFGRDTCVIAIGGGVTGDLAGFVAATYMRGLPLVHVPTTLLAMIDASIGGKTGVDTPAGKNLIGSFHAPRLVLIDPLALHTLPETELRAGLAEAVKHGAILDAAYFDFIETHVDRILGLDSTVLDPLIARSVELKATIVSEDAYEQARRTILNFGHTIAHALERLTEYSMPHGFAVAAGMVVEARIGEAVGVTAPGTAQRLAALLGRLGLPSAARATYDELIAAMRVDKKSRRTEPRFVLLQRVGACAQDEHGGWSHGVPPDVVREALAASAAPGASV